MFEKVKSTFVQYQEQCISQEIPVRCVLSQGHRRSMPLPGWTYSLVVMATSATGCAYSDCVWIEALCHVTHTTHVAAQGFICNREIFSNQLDMLYTTAAFLSLLDPCHYHFQLWQDRLVFLMLPTIVLLTQYMKNRVSSVIITNLPYFLYTG